jgi:hypothetical protein
MLFGWINVVSQYTGGLPLLKALEFAYPIAATAGLFRSQIVDVLVGAL